MAADPDKPEPLTLRRWSRRKLESARAGATTPPEPAAPAPDSPATPPDARSAVPVPSGAAVEPAPALPPVESLTIDSDFAPFLEPTVDESVRRAALKKLFADPRFNVMDGLDVYIDDYTKFTPVPPDIVRQLAGARYIFDPPKTRVNEQGVAEDVPPEEPVATQTPEQLAETSQASPPEIGAPPLPALPETAPEQRVAETPPSVPEPPAKKSA